MSGFAQKVVHADDRGTFCARRDFLRLLCVAPVALRLGWDTPVHLQLALLHDDANSGTLAGMRLSAQESQRAAQLLGGSLTIRELLITRATKSEALRQIVQGCDAAVIAVSPDLLPSIANVVPGDVVVVNAASGFTGCKENWWSVASTASDATTWDPRLERFGAAQLNDRFVKTNHSAMTAPAWQGWFAVKLLWESATRARGGIKAYLQSAAAAFDGHKGELLAFDESHVLRQPVYTWDGDRNEMVAVSVAGRESREPCARADSPRQ